MCRFVVGILMLMLAVPVAAQQRVHTGFPSWTWPSSSGPQPGTTEVSTGFSLSLIHQDTGGRSWLHGLVIGSVVGGVGGAYVGLALNNLINEGLVIGEQTYIGAAVGVVAGGMIGAGIGWLIDRR